MAPNFREVISSFSVEQILKELSAVDAIASPWAILLVRFRDNQSALPSNTIYDDLFTSAGIGKQNMVDFFRDMSHGKIDISGSKVFGWYTIPYNTADYVGNTTAGPGKLDRGGLLNEAKSLASAAGVDLTKFAGVVVSCLGAVDLCGWVGGMAALCDSLSLQPSLLGQEMGHGYGLDHARVQGSTDDYRDPWDVMSTAAYPSMEAGNTEFTNVGPGLNAWNMRGRGWLDETRVWQAPSGAWGGTIQLRPLHRTDLPGFLAAQIGEYLVEFRVPQRWDAAIGAPCILVHRFEDNHSYLMPAVSGSESVLVGDKFATGSPLMIIESYGTVEVTAIDMQSLTATLSIAIRPPAEVPSLVAQWVSQGVKVDGGGSVGVGPHIYKIPPRGPVFEMVNSVARYLSLQTGRSAVGSTLASQRSALADVVRAIIPLYAEADDVSEQPPGYAPKERQQER
jgi:hypothetical protein